MEKINEYLDYMLGKFQSDIELLQSGKDTPDDLIKIEALLLYRLDACASLLSVTKYQVNEMYNLNNKQNEKS